LIDLIKRRKYRILSAFLLLIAFNTADCAQVTEIGREMTTK